MPLWHFISAFWRRADARLLALMVSMQIAVQMGRDFSLRDAIRLDQLVGERQSIAVDPTGDVDGWLKAQKDKKDYKRPDAD